MNCEIMRFLLPDKDICPDKQMYYRTLNGTDVLSGDSLCVAKGDVLSFDTYFNSFSLPAYKDNTTLQTVNFNLVLSGTASINIKQSKHVQTENFEGEKQVFNVPAGSGTAKYIVTNTLLATAHCNAAEQTTLSLPVNIADLESHGMLYAEIIADDAVTFYGGSITATAAPTNPKVKIGLVFCTYKRETYVKKNADTIHALTDAYPDRYRLFVIDNGKTLTQEDVAGATLVPNANLGGSGGFTRGIIEVKADPTCTHALLMDDDIKFNTEIFNRTYAMLAYAKDANGIAIGASMLKLDKPYYQYEYGGDWLGYALISRNRAFDLREKQYLIKNSESTTPTYTAWWYSCFPIATVDKIGLPMPFFIKYDDVEYSLRAKLKIVLMNGLGVWHESFESKYSGELEYYIRRNEVIVNCLYYPDLKWFFHYRKLVVAVGKQLVYQRYFAVDLVFKAYKDFLRGGRYFGTINQEQLHSEIRAVVSKQRTVDELLEMGYDISSHEIFQGNSNKKKQFQQVISLNGYLLPKWTYNRKERRTFRLVNMAEARPRSFFRAYRVVQYNPETKMAFVTKQNGWRVIQSGARLVAMFFSMMFRFRHAARSFKKQFAKLTAEESWREKLGI